MSYNSRSHLNGKLNPGYTEDNCPKDPNFESNCKSPATRITVQQPAKLIVKKNIVYVKKNVPEPRLTCVVKKECVPRVTYIDKIIRQPKIVWDTEIRQVPQVCWKTVQVAQSEVITCPRLVYEKQEFCRPVLCQPKPQRIPVPAAKEYCCYVTGPPSLNRTSCPQNVCPPCPPKIAKKISMIS